MKYTNLIEFQLNTFTLIFWEVNRFNLICDYVSFFIFLDSCYSPMAMLLLRSAIHLLHDDLCRLQSAGEAQNEPFGYPAETEAFSCDYAR